MSNVIKGYITKENLGEAKKEITKLASMANKRLQRLEKAGLDNTPAYQKWLKTGGQKFSVKGKDYNQIQQELSRLRNFINAETSTIRGANNVLKNMAEVTGLKYKNLTDLRQKSKQFFDLSSKVEQYLRDVDDIASAIGYQKIWEAINIYVKNSKTDLAESEDELDHISSVVDLLIQAPNNRGDESYQDWWFME